jgi:hypothetical protein
MRHRIKAFHLACMFFAFLVLLLCAGAYLDPPYIKVTKPVNFRALTNTSTYIVVLHGDEKNHSESNLGEALDLELFLVSAISSRGLTAGYKHSSELLVTCYFTRALCLPYLTRGMRLRCSSIYRVELAITNNITKELIGHVKYGRSKLVRDTNPDFIVNMINSVFL